MQDQQAEKIRSNEASLASNQKRRRKKRDYSRRSALKVLVGFLGNHKKLALATLVAVICDMTGMLLVPTELSALINTAVNASHLSDLLPNAAGMLGASILGSGGAVISTYLATRLAANVAFDIRTSVYEASLDFSGSDFERFGTGSMITRTNSDINVIQQSLVMAILMILPVPIMCAISVALAFSIDVFMGQVLLVVTFATLAVCVVGVIISAPIFTRLQGFIDRMNVRVRENLTGVRVIRAFGKEKYERKRLDETFTDYANNAIKVNMVFAVTDSLSFFLMNAVEALLIWVGIDRGGAWAMQIGSISAIVEYAMLIMFFLMMAQFAMLSIPRALACLARVGQVIGLEPSIEDPDDPVELTDGTGEPGEEVVAFDHVSFCFDDADEDTLHDLTFSIKRGQVTAIIGNTGSGKSTIAKMLLRFHEVTHGALRFLGTDVRDVAQEDLRAHIAYVPQKAWLFSGTIESNLRDGDEQASTDRLLHALDIAQAGFVRELPDGIASRVAQGGTNFSGGQRQRLAIARALVRNTDLYVFDDSFSALDFKTDAALRRALSPELKNAATLIIAQRVSTIHDADQIVVLKDGSIVGLGKHDELMATCPVYRAIADSQAKKGDAHA